MSKTRSFAVADALIEKKAGLKTGQTVEEFEATFKPINLPNGITDAVANVLDQNQIEFDASDDNTILVLPEEEQRARQVLQEAGFVVGAGLKKEAQKFQNGSAWWESASEQDKMSLLTTLDFRSDIAERLTGGSWDMLGEDTKFEIEKHLQDHPEMASKTGQAPPFIGDYEPKTDFFGNWMEEVNQLLQGRGGDIPETTYRAWFDEGYNPEEIPSKVGSV